MSNTDVAGIPGPRPVPDETHPLMTIHAAARVLGFSDMTIRRQVEARRFPAVRIGSKTLVPRAFVEKLLADALAGRTVVVEEYAATWSRTVNMQAAAGHTSQEMRRG